MAWTPDPTTGAIFTNLVLHSAIGIIVYIIFECVRGGQLEIYAPKLRSKKHRCPAEAPSPAPFGWLTSTLSVSDEDTLKMVGMDGFIFLSFLRMCTKMGLVFGAAACIVLLPVYATSAGEAGVVGVNRLTMANIGQGDAQLWASFLFTYIFTLGFLYLMYKEYESFSTLRQQYLRIGDPDLKTQILYSVVVENIPKRYRSSKKLQDLFEEMFPGQVFNARIAMNLAPIIKASIARKKNIVAFEKNVAVFEASGRSEDKLPMVKVSADTNETVMCGGEKTAAIPFHAQKIVECNQRVAELKKQAADVDMRSSAKFVVTPKAAASASKTVKQRADEDCEEGGELDPMRGYDADVAAAEEEQEEEQGGAEEQENFTEKSIAGTGYVTFTSMRAQAAAYQVAVLSDRFKELKAFKAPAPADIIWSNVNASLLSIRSTSYITTAVYTAGLLFWAVVLSGIQSIATILLPLLTSLDAVTFSIVEGLLPVLLLLVFIALLPVIFAAVSTYIERRKTSTDVQMEVMYWYFCYQLANVYLTLLAGSVLDSLQEALGNPTSILVLLGTALPSISAFFLNLMITVTLSGVPIFLLRIVPLAIWKLYRSCFGEQKLTRRSLIEGPLAASPLQYSVIIPGLLYYLCIALTYWVISPILLIVSGFLFGANYLAFKYQLLYVIVNPVETGGMFWYRMFSFTMTGLMASSITMVAYMGIREGAIQAPLLFPLPFIVYMTWGHMDSKFRVISGNLAFSKAVDADVDKGSSGSSEEAALFDTDFFSPPLLSGPAEMKPEVYRVNDTPLLNDRNCLDEVYFASTEMQRSDMEEVAAAAGGGVGSGWKKASTAVPQSDAQEDVERGEVSAAQPLEIELTKVDEITEPKKPESDSSI